MTFPATICLTFTLVLLLERGPPLTLLPLTLFSVFLYGLCLYIYIYIYIIYINFHICKYLGASDLKTRRAESNGTPHLRGLLNLLHDVLNDVFIMLLMGEKTRIYYGIAVTLKSEIYPLVTPNPYFWNIFITKCTTAYANSNNMITENSILLQSHLYGSTSLNNWFEGIKKLLKWIYETSQ